LLIASSLCECAEYGAAIEDGDIAIFYERARTLVGLCLSRWWCLKACDMLSLLWCVFGLILYPSKDWLFLVMTASVIFGLVLGLLLLVLAPLSCSLQLVKQAHLKKSKLEKLRVSWVKCTIISG